MAPFEYVSDLGLNLHHVLYSAAFGHASPTAAGRAWAQPLPGELRLHDQPEFTRAVDWYRGQFRDRNLLFDPELDALKSFLAFGRGEVPSGWPEVFEPLRLLYAQTDWPTHDVTNRDWSRQVAERMQPILPGILQDLQYVFRDSLPDGPLRVDTVWAGHALPAYTSLGPVHVTCSTMHPQSQEWLAVEVVLHEACHALAGPLRKAIRSRVDPSMDRRGDLWHVVLFVLTGETVRRALAGIGVDHQPYLEATGLFDRAWPQWRKPVTEAWTGYLEGTTDWATAHDRLAAAVAS